MDIQLISFILAIVLGIVCYGLVRHTANEFDRWYDEQPTIATKPHLPLDAISLIAVLAAAAIFTVIR